NVAEPGAPQQRRHLARAVWADLDEDPSPRAEPVFGLLRSALDQEHPGRALVGERGVRLEEPDLVRELTDLPTAQVRRMERDDVDGTGQAPGEPAVEVAPHEPGRDLQMPGVLPGERDGLLREIGAVDIRPTYLVRHRERDRPGSGG